MPGHAPSRAKQTAYLNVPERAGGVVGIKLRDTF
jgi:hypothetical protein